MRLPCLDGNVPQVGDTYGLQLTYSDGTQETLTEKVNSVPGNFGASSSPAGVGTDLTPNFSWADPANASSYGYAFDLRQFSGPGSESWMIPGGGWGTFPSSIDSLTWGVDPTGGGNTLYSPTLVDGTDYQWTITATDSNFNDSELTVYYYPGYTEVYLPATNPSTLGPATVGQSYTGTISASNGTAPYAFVVSGLSDGLTYSASGATLTISGTPATAGTVTFQVTVQDNSGNTWGPVTYTINVGGS
jgi:hypothetical protein